MGQAKQEVRASKIGGKVTQASDVGRTEQTVTDIEATELGQRISSQQQSLSLGKYKAKGLYAVFGLVVLALAYLIVQFFLHK